MKNFEAPMMNIQRLDAGDAIVTSTQCSVEALNCASCYCVAVDCGIYCDHCDAHQNQCIGLSHLYGIVVHYINFR